MWATTHRCKDDIYALERPLHMAPNFELVVILRETLYRIDKESDPNDPTVNNLKRAILLAIAELEFAKEKEKDKGAAA